MTEWLIINDEGDADTGRYWSNADGWTCYALAERFIGVRDPERTACPVVGGRWAQTFSYAEAVREMRVDDLIGDPWGTAMCWFFAVAEELHFNRDGCTPDAWGYRPSPMGIDPSRTGRSETEVVEGMSDVDLMRFGRLLHRYASLLSKHGRSY